jgi:hypothetical protein
LSTSEAPRITNVVLHVTELEERAEALYHKYGLESLVSLETFKEGANMAIDEHQLNMGQYHNLPDGAPERAFLDQQKSLKLWKDPKDQVLTLMVCCLASLTQGWQQVSNGNLGWPHAFGLKVDVNNPTDHDSWIFGVVNAIMWWSAAVSALLITDPLQSHVVGRRAALLIAGVFSFASTIGASQTHSWSVSIALVNVLTLSQENSSPYKSVTRSKQIRYLQLMANVCRSVSVPKHLSSLFWSRSSFQLGKGALSCAHGKHSPLRGYLWARLLFISCGSTGELRCYRTYSRH